MNRSTPRRAASSVAPAVDHWGGNLWVIRLLLLAAILAAFGRAVGNDFVDWDDSQLIYLNPNLNPPTDAGLLHHWNPVNPANTGMYDPLVYTAWWGLAQGAQLDTPDLLGAKLNPEIFHAANLAVHWLTACLVVEILLRLKIAPWPAAGGALLFAIHPIQTEAVVWATGMKDLLCGFFSMATIWVHLAGAEKTGAERRKSDVGQFVLYIAAILAKPSAVALPLMVVMLDVVVLRREWRRAVFGVWPWLVVAGVTAVLARVVQPMPYFATAPVWTRPLVAADALAFYLAKLVLPIDLTFDYGRSPAAVFGDPALHHALWWTWIFPGAAAALLWHWRENRRLAAAGWIFLLGLLPVLGLTTFAYQFFSTVADRYAYVPMLGVALAAGLLIQKIPRRAGTAMVAVVTVVLIGLSFAQAGVWKDSEILYERGVALNGRNLNHWMVLGQYRDRQANVALRRAADAMARGDEADCRSDTQSAQAYLELAVDSYRHAIQINPEHPAPYDKLSYDLIVLQRMDEAIDVLRQLIALQPTLPEQARQDPGALNYTLGMACINAGRYAEAAAALEESLKVKGDPEVEKHYQEARRKMESATESSGGTRP